MAETIPPAGKVMATVFRDARGIFFTDYFKKRKTINGEFYAKLLHHVNDEIKKNGHI